MSNWRNHSSQSSEQPTRSRGGWRGRGRPAPRGSQAPPAVSNNPRPRQMEHIASVSRSSGLEKDGDTLKDFRVQEEYRVFLQGKMDDLFKRHPRKPTESEAEARQRIDAQENVLILFRKLREGVSSSRRNDAFALEAYETSLYLSVVFNSARQTTSIIPHLLPGLYLGISPPHHNCLATILVSLLHHLVVAYPSQSLFQQHLNAIPSSLLPQHSPASKWINSLSRSLRTRNYIKFEELTRPSAITRLLENSDLLSDSFGSLSLSPQDGRHEGLPRQALYEIVDLLRNKARATSWDVIRSAYRELSCGTEAGDWLTRSLCLKSLLPYGISAEAEQWLEQQSPLGHVRPKEGAVGRWIVCKVH